MSELETLPTGTTPLTQREKRDMQKAQLRPLANRRPELYDEDEYTAEEQEVMMEIERDEITMTEMLERLRNMILSAGELNLRQFFARSETRRELVLAFLSVLEIVRTSEIALFQETTFGDIIARANT